MTPFYERDGITIYCGDCLEVMPQLEGLFDAVITDPPFGTGTAEWDEEPEIDVWKELLRFCPEGPVAIFGYAKQLFRWSRFFGNLQMIGYIVWHKYNEILVSPGLTRAHQDIVVWGKSLKQVRAGNVREPYGWCANRPKWYGGLQGRYEDKKDGIGKRLRNSMRDTGLYTMHLDGRRCTDLWHIPAPGAGFNARLRNHPSEKPLEVMSRLCRLLTEPGQMILDCYMGSGTTLVAAQQLGRRAVGIEISEEYCTVAVERLRQRSLWQIITPPQVEPVVTQPELAMIKPVLENRR